MGLIVIVGGIILSFVLAIMADLSAAAAGLMAAASTAIGLTMTYKQAAKKEAEKQRIQEEEQRRLEELRKAFEETRRKERERNTLRFKCPYCGKEYAEYPAGSKETLRVCKDGCRRHFSAEDQTSRTPQDANTLAAEQRDAERVRSYEFRTIHDAVSDLTLSPSNCGWSVEFTSTEAIYYNGFEWIYLEYPSRLETTAGPYMLAHSCGRIFSSVLYHVSVKRSDISSRVRLWWCRRED